MPIEHVAGKDDPRVTDYRNVPDAELIMRRGLFVAEGRFVVQRVVRDRRFRLRSVLVSDAARRQLACDFAQIDPTVPIYICGAADFLGLSVLQERTDKEFTVN